MTDDPMTLYWSRDMFDMLSEPYRRAANRLLRHTNEPCSTVPTLPVQRDGHDDGWQPPIEPTRSPLGLGPRDVDDWGGAPTWRPCANQIRYPWAMPSGRSYVPCSRQLGHTGICLFPVIRIRTRYGIIRAVCHLCDWSATRDVELYQYGRAHHSAAAAASRHVRAVHR